MLKNNFYKFLVKIFAVLVFVSGVFIMFLPTSAQTQTVTQTAINTTNCPNSNNSTSVSGQTVTVNLCKIKAGNVVNINNLNTKSLDSIQLTFNSDLESGILQIVEIPQTLTYSNLSGNFLVGFELLTTNFKRTIIQSIKLDYHINNSEISNVDILQAKNNVLNDSWISNSELTINKSADTTKETTKFSAILPAFIQYALTAPNINSNINSRSLESPQTHSSNAIVKNYSAPLIRTGANSNLIPTIISIITIVSLCYIFSIAFFSRAFLKNALPIKTGNHSDFEI
jgi:hypothetical protein